MSFDSKYKYLKNNPYKVILPYLLSFLSINKIAYEFQNKKRNF